MTDRLFLETSRVRLRQVKLSDVELLLDLDSDPEVMRHLTGGRPSTREEAETAVARSLLYREKYRDALGVFIAERVPDGRFVGWFHLRPGKHELENLRDLELGYRLKREFWGRGYATETSRALIDLAFARPDVESVWAQTLRENAGSRRVMEKLGLVFEREEYEKEHDRYAVHYRLRRTDRRG